MARNFTFDNYAKIFTDPTWYWGYINSLIYVLINTALSVSVALPAAYAFSRYRFLGDKHLFFWLLSNRMAPPAVFALPFLQLYSAVGLFDTHISVALAHTLFNVPLAVWILEGFMSGVPKELDETAYVDGYSFWRFFAKIFVPTIAAGIGVACFFCFMFSWVELLLAKTLTSVEAKPISATMTRTASTSGYELGLLAAAGVLTIVPGAFVIYFVRNYIAKGFALGPRLGRKEDGWHNWSLMDGMDVANGGVLCFHIAGPGRHVGMGMVFARRKSAARHSGLGYDARRPALHLAARQRIHTPGLARDHGHSPVGGTCPLAHLRRGGVPLGLTKTPCGQRSTLPRRFSRASIVDGTPSMA